MRGKRADAVGGAGTKRLCAPRSAHTQTPLTSAPARHGGHVPGKVEACGKIAASAKASARRGAAASQLRPFSCVSGEDRRRGRTTEQLAPQTATFQSVAQTVRFVTPPCQNPEIHKVAAAQRNIPQQSISGRVSAVLRSSCSRTLTDMNDGVRLSWMVLQYPQGEAKQRKQLHLRLAERRLIQALGGGPTGAVRPAGARRKSSTGGATRAAEATAAVLTKPRKSAPPAGEQKSRGVGGGRSQAEVMPERRAAGEERGRCCLPHIASFLRV